MVKCFDRILKYSHPRKLSSDYANCKIFFCCKYLSNSRKEKLAEKYADGELVSANLLICGLFAIQKEDFGHETFDADLLTFFHLCTTQTFISNADT